MCEKEDKCRIEVQGEMTAERYASFTMLYVPLIGSDAAALYHTLVSIGTRNQKIRNHILIQTISRLSNGSHGEKPACAGAVSVGENLL